MVYRRGRDTEARALSSLHGLLGGGDPTISATSFQRKRRELREQTSVSARMNEEGPYDPQSKADANYDQAGVKDTGVEHQAGNPPPYSLTPHTPEQLHDPTGKDEGTIHQEGNPPQTSVEIRGGYIPGTEGDEREDQAQYAHLDKRDGPYTGDSEANVALSDVPSANATDAAKELAGAEGVDLASVEGTGADGRITKADVEKALG